jgi:DGQHR domain-containing protein
MAGPLQYKFISLKQGKYKLVVFCAPVKDIWEHFSINRRIEDKDEGYQRALSQSRVDVISKYVKADNALPLSILASLEEGKYTIEKDELAISDETDVGWIIDGQHRLAGAYKSGTNIMIPVVAFLGINPEEQINQFVTINREAKGVPTSLYYDLLKHLPIKNITDRSKQRASDIATDLKKNEESPFFGRIVAITSPKRGEISLTTFIKAMAPLVSEGKGFLSAYTFQEQAGIIDNYYRGIKNIFPRVFNKEDPIFFKTTGFGAMFKAFPVIFNYTLKIKKGFSVADVSEILKNISDFDFEAWKKIGTGNAAEIQASEDLKKELETVFMEHNEETKIRLW